MRLSSKRKNILYLFLILSGIFWLLTQTKNDEPVVRPENAIVRNISTDEDAIDINLLTDEKIVIAHLKEFGQLPDYYITKNKAREKGWQPSQGNLCDVLPGKAIGGDRFGNREGLLPPSAGRAYFEADINYDCGHRTADRIVYSNDGLIFVTYDHYKSFHPVEN